MIVVQRWSTALSVTGSSVLIGSGGGNFIKALQSYEANDDASLFFFFFFFSDSRIFLLVEKIEGKMYWNVCIGNEHEARIG